MNHAHSRWLTMIKAGVAFCLTLSASAQIPPKIAIFPSIRNEVRSIEGAVKAKAPEEWSTTRVAFGARPDMALGEGFKCSFIKKKVRGKAEGFEECYFVFKVYQKADAEAVFQKAVSRKLHPWLELPEWSRAKKRVIDQPAKAFSLNRLEYLPEKRAVSHRSFSDQVLVASIGEDVVVAYFYGGENRKRQEELFFQLLDLLKAGYQTEAPVVPHEITSDDVEGTQPKTTEDAVRYLDKRLSDEEKDAVLAAFGKKAAPVPPAPVVDGSQLTPYLTPFQNGRVPWEEWIARHWGLDTGDSPLARSLEIKGLKSSEEMVLFLMKSLHPLQLLDEAKKR